MTEIFRTVLNMSITGAYIAAAIIILRIAMKKLPKQYSYLLWAILGIRLLFPFSFSSTVSIFNVLVPEKPAVSSGQMEFIPNDIVHSAEPGITVYVPPVNNAINKQLLPAKPTERANPMQTAMTVGAYIWAFGTLAMAVCTAASYISVRKKVKNAKLADGNVYICKNIETPFVFGLLKPHIYLPENLSAEDRPYIIAHERTHIRRKDYIVKLIAMAVLCVHWFNPMVWISYRLMTKDMELSCDEKALGSFDTDVKKAYANALLNISLRQNKLSLGGVLSFGESNIKSRIRGVLGAKKPGMTAVIVAIIAVIAAAVCLLTNAVKKDDSSEPIPNGIYVTDKLLYSSPLKSSYWGDDNGLTYEVRDGTLTISGENLFTSPQIYTLSKSIEIPFTDEEWDNAYNIADGFAWQDGAKHLSDYKNKYCAEILTNTDGGIDSYIFVMDGELWYVRHGWEIYRLKSKEDKPADEPIGETADVSGTKLNAQSNDIFGAEACIVPIGDEYRIDLTLTNLTDYELTADIIHYFSVSYANIVSNPAANGEAESCVFSPNEARSFVFDVQNNLIGNSTEAKVITGSCEIFIKSLGDEYIHFNILDIGSYTIDNNDEAYEDPVPELTPALGMNGIIGYMKRDDYYRLNEDEYEKYSEIVTDENDIEMYRKEFFYEYGNAISQYTFSCEYTLIPLYDENGETVVDHFRLQGIVTPVPPDNVELSVGKEKAWTEQELINFFNNMDNAADLDYIECTIMPDQAYDLVGAVLFENRITNSSGIAFFDANGYSQSCSFQEKTADDPKLAYIGSGTVTFCLETENNIIYDKTLTVSIDGGNVNFKSEDDLRLILNTN